MNWRMRIFCSRSESGTLNTERLQERRANACLTPLPMCVVQPKCLLITRRRNAQHAYPRALQDLPRSRLRGPSPSETPECCPSRMAAFGREYRRGQSPHSRCRAAAAAAAQISVCSEISRASSTSMPRYRTVDSSLECPSSSCTARRFFVRRYISVAFVLRIECVP